MVAIACLDDSICGVVRVAVDCSICGVVREVVDDNICWCILSGPTCMYNKV